MSYHIHTTEGIILRRVPLENDAVYVILTSDFGIVYAKAVGVRKVNSKLKFSLQQYFLSSISFIKSRRGFKITSASFIENLFDNSSKIKKKALFNICKILEKFILSEEKNEQIYKSVREGLLMLNKVDDKDVLVVEAIILLSVLFHLGYVDLSSFDSRFLVPNFDILDQAKTEINTIVKMVNNALSLSNL